MRTVLSKLVHWLVMDCQTATFYIDMREYATIPWRRRVQLKLHLWLCGPCQTYETQAQALSKLVEGATAYMAEEQMFTLCPESKSQLKKSIEDEINKKR